MKEKVKNVLILAPQASAKFGGESVLPLHYFTKLPDQGVNTYMIVHERTRPELEKVLAGKIKNVRFIKDTVTHQRLFAISKLFPARIAHFTFVLFIGLLTQISQKKVAKKMIKEKQIDLIHVPTPVSPKFPSMFFNMGVPVIFGPMNGGMVYPPAFARMESKVEKCFVGIGRFYSGFINRLLPGKREAAVLLVANERSRAALPPNKCRKVLTVVENGVDLDVFNYQNVQALAPGNQVKFIYLGRLVDWKRVDILIRSAKILHDLKFKFSIEVVGDGVDRVQLETLSDSLGLKEIIKFHGFVAQHECPELLASCDCLVLPSLYECGGAVVLEAMSMSRAAIAVNWGGPVDYLDESCGILVDPHEGEDKLIENFTNAMKRIIVEPELAVEMGKSGRAKVLEKFDWKKKINKIITIYNDAINDVE